MVSDLKTQAVTDHGQLFTPIAQRRVSVIAGLIGLWSLRDLIGMMTYRDLLGRYRGSLMGAFWPIINPLGHLLLYTFVFNVILSVRFGSDPSTANFALYLMTGLIPWGAFAEAISRSTTAILEVPNLVNRVVFPLEILPLVLVVSSLLSQIVGVVLVILMAFFYTHTLHVSLVFLPLIVISQVLFTAGLSWLFAALGVFARDLQHISSLALSVWMYGTPIVYPASKFPANFSFLLYANPMAGIVGDYRRVLLEGQPPDWTSYAVYTLAALVIFFLGFAFFFKVKPSFADVM